jgi:non-heme chloroperoxidase
MPTVTCDDGAQIYYKDWGCAGTPVLLSHGWPLNSDAWESAALFLADNGHRVIAHDRRGHGRSSQTWNGNEMDTYADDLATLINTLDLRDLTLVGHSTGGGEIVHYLGRHGSERVARLVLVSAVSPMMVQTDNNPDGLPIDTFDAIRAGEAGDRSQLYRDLADGPFFGHNRNNDISQGVRDAFWLQSMACGHRGAYECIAAFSATDFRQDLAAVDVPTLVIHGDDDQIVPFDVGGKRSATLIEGAVLTVYEGGAHGLPDTAKDRLHDDLLMFINS